MKRTVINTYVLYFIFAGCALLTANKLSAQCVDEGNYWNKSWTSCEKTMSPNATRGAKHWLLYEFDEPQNISGSYIWNANLPGTGNTGARNVIIDYSVDGNTWIELGNFNFPKANESSNYNGFEGPDFSGVFIKKILFTILNTYGDNACASIAEIQFNVNEDACYGTLDECGVCNGTGKLTWYLDADDDGLGTPNQFIKRCSQPTGYVANKEDYCDNDMLGWNEVHTIFLDDGCLNCHIDGHRSGLSLTSYENFLQGGYKCGSAIASGNTLANIINIDRYNGCGTAIEFPSMNSRADGNIDASEIALLQKWIDTGAPEDCNCLPGSVDSDFDGTCDAIDSCTNFDNNLIGTTCDDFDDCTENDVWINECDCKGTIVTDSDEDGVCDNLDASPFNACTADGIIDGIEPNNWEALLSNDCDADEVFASNDINDFDSCINNIGSANTIACNCPGAYLTIGGKLKESFDLGNDFRGEGLPDGNFTNGIYTDKSLTLIYPWMPVGEEICFTIGFNNAEGAVTFSINYYPFTYFNEDTALTDFEPQQICIKTIEEGPQEIIISESGKGSIKVDGSVYNYCPCNKGDIYFNAPACNCEGNTINVAGTYKSNTDVSNPDRAGGLPDGNLTSNISGVDDELVIEFPAPNTCAEICMSFLYTDALGLAKISINNEINYLPNYINDALETIQEFCLPASGNGVQTLKFYDSGAGVVRFDGAYVRYCDTQTFKPCGKVLEVTYNDITADGIFISWNQVQSAKQYTVKYRNASESTFKIVNLTDNFIRLNDLTACNDYIIQVRSRCNNNKYSGFKSFNFSTAGCPDLCENIITEFSFSNLQSSVQQVSNFVISNGKINNGVHFKYKAGNFIELQNGFEVKQDANFEAMIEGCDN